MIQCDTKKQRSYKKLRFFCFFLQSLWKGFPAIHYVLLLSVPFVEVSDTTGDAINNKAD
jgi:hypothetical protein